MKTFAFLKNLQRDILREVRQKPKSGFSFREWLLAIFAGISLCLTLLTTWLANLRSVDDIRVILNEIPTIILGAETVVVYPNMMLTS
jgi:hypothetical protein